MKFNKWYLIIAALLADASPELMLSCYSLELENLSDSPSDDASLAS